MPRSVWKGSISFGLVSIPIKLFPATEDRSYSFNQLCKNGHRIQYKRWCPVENRDVPYEEINKGLEISKDNYVLIEKEELQNIKVKSSKTIEIAEFVDMDQLDPILVQKSYYVAPDSKTSDKAYSLLGGILRGTGRVGIGKVVLRDKEEAVALRSYQRGIVMHVVRYTDEIRPMDEIKEITEMQRSKPDEQEMSLGKMLVDKMSTDSLDLSKYSDEYTRRLHELVESKAAGKQFVQVPETDRVEPTKDLLAALKASVSSKPKPARKRP